METEIVIGIAAGVLGVEAESLRSSTDLVRDLGADNLDLFVIAVAVEEKIRRPLDREKLHTARTIGEIAALMTA